MNYENHEAGRLTARAAPDEFKRIYTLLNKLINLPAKADLLAVQHSNADALVRI
ncbi:hypothetical protein [Spirosoma litoris]